MFDSICVFTSAGKTFTFRLVDIEVDNETVLAFKYCAMSDMEYKHMIVYKSQIIGYSTFTREKP